VTGKEFEVGMTFISLEFGVVDLAFRYMKARSREVAIARASLRAARLGLRVDDDTVIAAFQTDASGNPVEESS
jgi:hypothetical protein